MSHMREKIVNEAIFSVLSLHWGNRSIFRLIEYNWLAVETQKQWVHLDSIHYASKYTEKITNGCDQTWFHFDFGIVLI